jgi:hypothetical protein
MFDWLNCIINPFFFFFVMGIFKNDAHLFQIFAFVFCDLMWFSKNQAVHNGVILDATIHESFFAHKVLFAGTQVGEL